MENLILKFFFEQHVKKLNVAPSEALVLEDSESGILAAYDGKIDVLCIPDMKYPEADFASKATKIISSLKDVIEYLSNSESFYH